MPKISKAERFWSKVDKSDDCWEWMAGLFSTGYGNFFTGEKGRKDSGKGAHRVAWELTLGDIPDGLCVLHHCDNRKCVNPDHLFLGTHKDNVQDMWTKGRQNHHKRETHVSSKLTVEQVGRVRLLYSLPTVTQRMLAGAFGVSQQLISRLAN